jgi:YebC/PmpR family DNA-binding regulatory protein
MAGHSKWANIKRKKAAKDAKKGQAFARFSREIMKAAQLGGGDPAGNFRLRTAIDKAKAAGIPNDNIDRAIARGVGNDSADRVEEMTYEGYGPGGVAVLIETMTDNRNRTAGDIRSYFNKYNGNLGADGCVAWIFTQKGLIQVPLSEINEDELFEKAAEAGADDVSSDADEGVYVIQTEPGQLNFVAQALSDLRVPLKSVEMSRIPQNSVEVTDPAQARDLLRLLDAIESHDDVQAVYANFEIAESLLESLHVS